MFRYLGKNKHNMHCCMWYLPYIVCNRTVQHRVVRDFSIEMVRLTLEKLIKKIKLFNIKRGFSRFISLDTELDILRIFISQRAFLQVPGRGECLTLRDIYCRYKMPSRFVCFDMFAMTCSKDFQFFWILFSFLIRKLFAIGKLSAFFFSFGPVVPNR